MAVFKSGDLVVLRSGGPIMTIDTVNTDIFDDDKMTGVFCAWFVGSQLTRVRFDHRAIELAVQAVLAPADVAPIADAAPIKVDVVAEPEASGDYKDVLDTMMGAMNTAPDPLVVTKPAAKPPRRPRAAPRQPVPEKTH